MANKKPLVLTNGQPEQLQSSDKIAASDVELDTDGTLAANSDSAIASQKAVRTYVAANSAGGNNPLMAQIFS